MNSDDSALLVRWKTERDPESLDRLIEKYAGLVYTAALRVTRNSADADDVLQDSFLALADKAPSQETPLGAWLHRVATRRAIDLHRAETRRRVREEKWANRNHESEIRDAETLDQIRRSVDAAIDALPDLQRTAIVLHFVAGLSHERIAEEEGISRPAVTQRIRNGLDALRKRLVPAGVSLDDATLMGLVAPVPIVATQLSQSSIARIRAAISKKTKAPARRAAARPALSGGSKTAVLAKLALLAAVVALIGAGALWMQGNVHEAPRVANDSIAVAPVGEPAKEPAVTSNLAQAPKPAEADAPAAPNPIPASAPATTNDGSPVPSIEGRVFDQVSGSGLAGVSVKVQALPRSSVGPATADKSASSAKVLLANATTDGKGHYELSKLPAGQYLITLDEYPAYPMTKEGRSTKNVIVSGDSAGAARADFALAQSGTLTGRVTVNGTPMANMHVLIDSEPRMQVSELTSDERGNYRIDGLGNYSGSLRARGSVSGTRRGTPYVAAHVEAGLTTRADFDFLQGSASIEGDVIVHDGDGNTRPAEGNVVVTYAYVDGDEYNVENMDLPADSKGHYHADGLWGGRVTVGVYPQIPGVHRHRYTFQLGEDEHARQDFHFYQTRIDVHIAKMPKDKGLDVWLVAIPGHVDKIEGSQAAQRDFVESQQRCVGSVRTDALGGASGSLGGLAPGEYTILACGVLGSHTLINHAAGEEFYRRGRTVRTYATLPERTRSISVEMTFPDEP